MIGETFGNFRVVSRLGRGGMGEVYLAEQQSIGTRVAIKLLQPEISEDKDHVQRFFNEARAVSRIQHAGIAKIFDSGYHPMTGQAYLIMEHLEGETLGRRIRRAGRLPLAQVAELGRQIASVLEATHAAGITHRDLKPDNIYLVPDRELASGERVKILDFGIAKLTGTLAGASPKTMGTLGTPAYMAPEQWGDSSKVDSRADLYALGCVAFEIATGRVPFIAANYAEACAKHLTEPPPSAGVNDVLDDLLLRMLAKDPAARPTMHQVLAAFDGLGKLAAGTAETISAAPPALVAQDRNAQTVATGVSRVPVPPPPGFVASDLDTETVATGVSRAPLPAPIPATTKRRIRFPIMLGATALALAGMAIVIVYLNNANKPRKLASVPVVDAGVDASVDAPIAIIATPDAAPAPIDVSAFEGDARRALENRRAEFVACYKKRERTGTVQVTVDINTAGTVERVSTTEPDEKLEGCLKKVAAPIVIAKPPIAISQSLDIELRKRQVATHQAPAVGASSADPLDTRIGSAEAPTSTSEVLARRQMKAVQNQLLQCVTSNVPRVAIIVEVGKGGDIRRVDVPNLPAAERDCIRGIVMKIEFDENPSGKPINYSFLVKRSD